MRAWRTGDAQEGEGLESSMRAWRTGDSRGELDLIEAPIPTPRPGEVLIKVAACGICRTDLHIIDREIPVRKPNVVPGHQAVGHVISLGPETQNLRVGDLVGVAWLGSTCGVCEWCRSGAENLCPRSKYTGWDEDGGFAEYVTARADYVYRLPPHTDAVQTAPLLCAGIIGYRALERARLVPGGHLGIYGFGSSAHLVAPLAIAGGARFSAMTRGEQNRLLARRLGASFVGKEADAPPEPLDAAIIFAPAGELVPVALRATKSGGTVVLAGIEMSDLPAMSYEEALFRERDLRTVTANTREDGRRLLALAHNLRLHPSTTRIEFDHLDDAIDDIRAGRARGSLVLQGEISPPGWVVI